MFGCDGGITIPQCGVVTYTSLVPDVARHNASTTGRERVPRHDDGDRDNGEAGERTGGAACRDRTPPHRPRIETVADSRDPFKPRPIENKVEPTVAGRLARWMARARISRPADAARSRHSSIDFGFSLVSGTRRSGAGCSPARSPSSSPAPPYKPLARLRPRPVPGHCDKSPGTVAREAGLHGLIASEVAQAASGRNRAFVFVLIIPAVLYTLVTLYRSIAKVHAMVWLGSGAASG